MPRGQFVVCHMVRHTANNATFAVCHVDRHTAKEWQLCRVPCHGTLQKMVAHGKINFQILFLFNHKYFRFQSN